METEERYVVIFSSRLREDAEGYGEAAARMAELVQKQPGFLGMESVRDAEGRGITISWWRDEASIRAWKDELEHRAAQERGRGEWYVRYSLTVARVERSCEFEAEGK